MNCFLRINYILIVLYITRTFVVYGNPIDNTINDSALEDDSEYEDDDIQQKYINYILKGAELEEYDREDEIDNASTEDPKIINENVNVNKTRINSKVVQPQNEKLFEELDMGYPSSEFTSDTVPDKSEEIVTDGSSNTKHLIVLPFFQMHPSSELLADDTAPLNPIEHLDNKFKEIYDRITHPNNQLHNILAKPAKIIYKLHSSSTNFWNGIHSAIFGVANNDGEDYPFPYRNNIHARALNLRKTLNLNEILNNYKNISAEELKKSLSNSTGETTLGYIFPFLLPSEEIKHFLNNLSQVSKP